MNNIDSPKNSLCLPAPAKLNLFLHITGQRDDGYHLLQTLFQFLDYGDEIRLTRRSDAHIRRLSDLEGVAEADDLVVKAAHLLRQHYDRKCTHHQIVCETLGVDLAVKKRLPMGGGLGGGSSDAATVLLGLNQLWQCGYSVEELATLGVKLGADVPVFVFGQSAWAEGIGEQLQAVELEEPWFLVVNPKVHVSTEKLFSHQDLTRDCEIITIAAFLEQGGANVFEPLVCKEYPEVAEALVWLSRYSVAKMTGSGSCIYSAFKEKKDAIAILDQLPNQWQGFIAKACNTSPLKQALRKYIGQ